MKTPCLFGNHFYIISHDRLKLNADHYHEGDDENIRIMCLNSFKIYCKYCKKSLAVTQTEKESTFDDNPIHQYLHNNKE